MSEERIFLQAKRKKELNDLGSIFSDLGFTKIVYSSEVLTIEKMKGTDLDGKPFLEYRMEFRENGIFLTYFVPSGKNKFTMLLDVLPTFLDVLQLVEAYYELRVSDVFVHVNSVLNEFSKIVDRDTLEFSTELTQMQERYDGLKSRYESLVRSSEANARLLLEAEQKREEMEARLKKLLVMSDELLKETIYRWIKLHGGSFDIGEFSKVNSIIPSRVEEGLNLLMRDGYIKKRFR